MIPKMNCAGCLWGHAVRVDEPSLHLYILGKLACVIATKPGGVVVTGEPECWQWSQPTAAIYYSQQTAEDALKHHSPVSTLPEEALPQEQIPGSINLQQSSTVDNYRPIPTCPGTSFGGSHCFSVTINRS